MKVLIINSVCGIGSTGRICTDLAQRFEEEGHEVKIAYGRTKDIPEQFRKYGVRIGNGLDLKAHALRTRLLDQHGMGSRMATIRFLDWAEEYNPDLVWLHNLHGYYINIELLFKWIKSRPQLQVKWTLHDCWAFTGHCAYFTMARCDQWKQNCTRCPQSRSYPKSWFGTKTEQNYCLKKQLFTGIHNLTIITPSRWLASLVKESFLQQYPVIVCNNTIDTNVFKYTPGCFRQRYRLEDKTIVLGVASEWGQRKGLDDFVKLSDILDSSYAIVMVGLTEKQCRNMPSSIIAIRRTNSPQELAEIYSTADVFLNLTYEDNYPTVNLEAQACGTPVLTYATGGSVESVPPENVIAVGDLNAVVQKLYHFKQVRLTKQSLGSKDEEKRRQGDQHGEY